MEFEVKVRKPKPAVVQLKVPTGAPAFTMTPQFYYKYMTVEEAEVLLNQLQFAINGAKSANEEAGL